MRAGHALGYPSRLGIPHYATACARHATRHCMRKACLQNGDVRLGASRALATLLACMLRDHALFAPVEAVHGHGRTWTW